MNPEPAERIDLLVHPFYSLSKIYLRDRLDGDSERNIMSLRKMWLDSIVEVARNRRRYFVLVNRLDLPDYPSNGQYANPFRVLYKEIIRFARDLGDRFLDFSPNVQDHRIEVEPGDDGLVRGRKDGTTIVYDPAGLRIVAYGEHLGEENAAGCVNQNAEYLASALDVPYDHVSMDPDRSLPLVRCVRLMNSGGEYGRYEVPSTIYHTVSQLRHIAASILDDE